MTTASDERYAAEAEKFRAEAESIRSQTAVRERRNTDILNLTTEKLKIELDNLRLVGRTQAAVAAVNEFQADRMRRDEEMTKANDAFNQRYYFSEAIKSKSVHECIQLLTYWSNSRPGCDITVIFNSPGGSFFDGMMLFDFIEELKARGHKVIVGTYGMAASMAGILLQAGTIRYVGAESWTLIHEISDGIQGSASQIADHSAFNNRLTERIKNIFMRRAKNITADEFMANFNRKEWWLSSDDMKRYGFADNIGFPIPETEVTD